MTKALKWNESVIHDSRFKNDFDLEVRSICEMTVGPRRLIDDIYFEGLDVLRCYEGGFRFVLDGNLEIELKSEDAMVLFPGHRVTIDATGRKNRIVYGIFGGEGVVEYFDHIGFFDTAKGKTRAHYESICELRRQLEISEGAVKLDGRLRSFLTDILSSQFTEMRENSNKLVFDAIRQINHNLRNGIVRLDPLCEQLGVCRSHLFRVFREEGIGSPSALIRQKQLQLALRLLNRTRLSVNEVAHKAGFISIPHFVTFMKKQIGQTPGQIRENHIYKTYDATN